MKKFLLLIFAYCALLSSIAGFAFYNKEKIVVSIDMDGDLIIPNWIKNKSEL